MRAPNLPGEFVANSATHFLWRRRAEKKLKVVVAREVRNGAGPAARRARTNFGQRFAFGTRENTTARCKNGRGARAAHSEVALTLRLKRVKLARCGRRVDSVCSIVRCGGGARGSSIGDRLREGGTRQSPHTDDARSALSVMFVIRQREQHSRASTRGRGEERVCVCARARAQTDQPDDRDARRLRKT